MTAAEDPHQLVGAYVLHALPAAEEASFTEMKQKVEMLQTENADLAEAKKQLAKDVEAKSGELARLKDDIAGVENGKPADDKADGDKDDKKTEAAAKDDKKTDKRADKADKPSGEL